MFGCAGNVLSLLSVILLLSESVELGKNCSKNVATMKYQLSGDDFVSEYYLGEKILRTTEDYAEWPLYNYWRDNALELDSITVTQKGHDNFSLKDLQSSSEKFSFEHEITKDQEMLAKSALLPLSVISCRDLFYDFREGARYYLQYSNVEESDFQIMADENMFLIVISGKLHVEFGEACHEVFGSRELIYVPPDMKTTKSWLSGKFLAVKVLWKVSSTRKVVKCGAPSLQSLTYQRGLTRNTSRDAQIGDLKLNTGFSIPPVGLGMRSVDSRHRDVINAALKIGYRLFEISLPDGDESMLSTIGEAIKNHRAESGNDIFLCLRITLELLLDDGIYKVVNSALDKLNTNYVDLVILELPIEDKNLATELTVESVKTVWKQLVVMQRHSAIHSLGVANVQNLADFHILYDIARETLSVVQNWFDPFKQDTVIRETCENLKIIYMGYGVLGFHRMKLEKLTTNPFLSHPLVIKLAMENDMPRGNLLLRWVMQKGIVVMPSTQDEYHLENNFYTAQVAATSSSYKRLDNEFENTTDSAADELLEALEPSGKSTSSNPNAHASRDEF